MIVVSDTSPLNYLVLIEAEHLLPRLFGDVFVPPAVVAELSRPETPEIVRKWVENGTPWLQIQSPATLMDGLELDPGETEAISLSVELRADSLLIDDRKGRNAAAKLGLTTVGTLTLLEQAAAQGLISLPEAIAKLQSTNFRISHDILQAALDRDRARHGPSN